MTTRRWILGAVILVCCFFLYQCQKQAKETKNVATISEAAKAGQYHKIDKKILNEAIKQYKQPELPPLTTLPTANPQSNNKSSYQNVNPQNVPVVAQAAPVQQPTTGPVNTAGSPTQNPTSATVPPSTVQPMQSRDSYVPPIEDKTVTQQPATTQPAPQSTATTQPITHP